MPCDTDHALDLAGNIYDAALDPALWRDVLARVSAFVGGPASAMVSHDILKGQNRFHFIWGDNPAYTRSYAETYARMNPLVRPLMALRPGDVWTASDFMPTAEFHATQFYQEWVRPQGYEDMVGAMIERTGSVVTTLSTTMDEARSPVTPEAKRRMGLLVPHVRRAVAIGNVLEMKRVEAEALGDTLDALGSAVFLLRRDGSVVRMNAAARSVLASGRLFRFRDSVLDTLCDAVRRDFHRTLSAAVDGYRTIGGRAPAVPLLDATGQRFIAHFLPLDSGRRYTASTTTGAAAAVFVHRAELATVLPVSVIARQFALSKAEQRVLVASIQIGAPAEVAPVLGLSEATVRTHLRRLYEKTGTGRQADLVKLVAAYAGPLAEAGDHPRAQ